MSTQAIGGVAPPGEGDSIAVVNHSHQSKPAANNPGDNFDTSNKPTGLHSPPDSNNAMKLDGSDDSELSDLDDAVTDQLKMAPEPAPATANVETQEEEDIGDVEPAEYSGTVPVFRPTMHQFKDFKKFMEKVDKYGMKSGIIKIIPPQEWKDGLTHYDDLVKAVRVREPIKQDILGSGGTYRQINMLHQRSYNLPQWRQLCDQSEHQPPARRGERRANAEKAKSAPKTRAAAASAATPDSATPAGPKKRGRKPKKTLGKQATAEPEARPMTPESPRPEQDAQASDKVVNSVEADPAIKIEEEDDRDMTPVPRRMGFSRQGAAKTQSTSARRKYVKREGSVMIDEAAFKDWDYKMDISDYTPERCEELERIYWKTLTYAQPLYGADLMGTLFHESTENWNLNKLPNLLDVLGTKVPGVNTAYLYLGMWKATFAWHLEDVDLYSINYLHFGAPKQWYSISQGDARRFEAAMKQIWPSDAKACDQFLRHKSFLISPTHLQQHYGIKVNKCVSYPGEFVVTYPYGYHSGYNLGYNCAEAVNFALDSWLPMGKIAKKCECAQAQDSVWVDVYEIERKLRGESTEYEETEDEDDEEEEEDEDEPHASQARGPRSKAASLKRKRVAGSKKGPKVKKIRLRVKSTVEPPCCLCPNDIPGEEILPTDDGRKAHRTCALYLPETYIETEDGKEVVLGSANIEQERLDLRCLYCRSKKGACFQCSSKKCARAYHATCAAAAGVFVEEEEIPIFGEDGTEYKEQAFEFSCRFHRTKRDKNLDGDALEQVSRTRHAAAKLEPGDVQQFQFYRGDIFAGTVVENRPDERAVLVDILPRGDRVEIEWKWLLVPDAADFKLPKASATALPMPTTKKAKDQIHASKQQQEELPRAEDTFVEGYTWAEFKTCKASECANPHQVKVNMFGENQPWYFVPRGSTEAKAQYTEDPAKPVHNPKSVFLDSIPRPVFQKPAPKISAVATTPMGEPRRSYSEIKPPYVPHSVMSKPTDKPYVYKPRKPFETASSTQFTPQQFAPPSAPGAQAYQPYAYTNAHSGLAGSQTGQQIAGTGVTGYPPQQNFGGSSQSVLAQSPAMSPQSHMFPPPAPISSTSRSMQAGQSSQTLPSGTLNKEFKFPATKQSTTPIPPPVVPTAKPEIHKYPYFQRCHNRDSGSYRTPYAPWGGFTNGYEGNLRAHLMSKHAKTHSKTPSSSSTTHHRKTSSFGLGGGLTGLTRPSPHTNYNNRPPSSSSSASSPRYSSSYNLPYGTGAGSSASSYASFDTMMNSRRMTAHSPTPSLHDPFAGSPGEQMSRYEMGPPNRPQYGSWQHNFHASMNPNPFTQGKTPLSGSSVHEQKSNTSSHQGADVGFSPPSPITAAGSLAPSPVFQPQTLAFPNAMNGPTPFMPLAPPVREPPADPVGKQSPEEQLKQQLRRISDPFLPDAYSAHPSNQTFRRKVVAHAPIQQQISPKVFAPAQAAASEPQQPQPHLHRPALGPQPNLSQGYYQQPNSPYHNLPHPQQRQLPVPGPVNPRPLTGAEEATVQRMMANLHQFTQQ